MWGGGGGSENPAFPEEWLVIPATQEHCIGLTLATVCQDAGPMLPTGGALGERAGSWVSWLLLVAFSEVLQDVLTQASNG